MFLVATIFQNHRWSSTPSVVQTKKFSFKPQTTLVCDFNHRLPGIVWYLGFRELQLPMYYSLDTNLKVHPHPLSLGTLSIRMWWWCKSLGRRAHFLTRWCWYPRCFTGPSSQHGWAALQRSATWDGWEQVTLPPVQSDFRASLLPCCRTSKKPS